MKYTHKDLAGSAKHIEVNLTQVEFSKYWDVVYEDVLKEVEIKGFRKGTAPRQMADAAVDKDKVFSEAATRAIREILKEITQEKDWEIIDQPKVNIEEKEGGIIFQIDVIVFPEIKLGDYKKISKKYFSEKKEVSVGDDEIQEAINWILNSRAKIVRTTNPAKMGDVVNIEYKGKPDQFVLGHSHIEKGLDEKIVGHKEGEEFDGIKLSGVFERQLPELNDALAQELGTFKTVDELKNSIKEGIQKEKEIKESEKIRMKVLEEVIKDSKMEIPEVMVEKTLAGMMEEYRAYFKDNFKEDEVREKLKSQAQNSVASSLVLYKIAKDEKIEPTAEEIEAESNKFLATLRPEHAQKIDPQRIYNYSYDIVKNKKVFDFLETSK